MLIDEFVEVSVPAAAPASGGAPSKWLERGDQEARSRALEGGDFVGGSFVLHAAHLGDERLVQLARRRRREVRRCARLEAVAGAGLVEFPRRDCIAVAVGPSLALVLALVLHRT